MKLYLLAGWATRSTVWNTVVESLSNKLDVEPVDWWEVMNGELNRRIAESSGRCIVAGWSMGGQIALRTAAGNPDNLAGLFLVSSMTSLVESGDRPGVSSTTPYQIEVMLKRNRRVYLRAFFSQCLHPVRNAQAVGNLLEESDSITMGNLLAGLEYMAHTEVGLTASVPLMMVHGRDDSVIPWECSEYIGRRTSGNSRVKYIKQAGHLLPVTEPETIGNLLNEFSDYCNAR